MYNNPNRLWRKHNTKIIFGTLIAGSLLFSYKDIARNMQNLSAARETIATNSTKQQLLEEQLQYEQAQDKIATARYNSGCTMVVAANSPRNLATLVVGEPVFDRTTQKNYQKER